jgi:hypothetical protein
MDFLKGKKITPSDYRRASEKTKEEFDRLSARLRKGLER